MKPLTKELSMRSRPTTLLATAGLIGAVALAACTPGSNADNKPAASRHRPGHH